MSDARWRRKGLHTYESCEAALMVHHNLATLDIIIRFKKIQYYFKKRNGSQEEHFVPFRFPLLLSLLPTQGAPRDSTSCMTS